MGRLMAIVCLGLAVAGFCGCNAVNTGVSESSSSFCAAPQENAALNLVLSKVPVIKIVDGNYYWVVEIENKSARVYKNVTLEIQSEVAGQWETVRTVKGVEFLPRQITFMNLLFTPTGTRSLLVLKDGSSVLAVSEAQN
jgi:hypothetical protein